METSHYYSTLLILDKKIKEKTEELDNIFKPSNIVLKFQTFNGKFVSQQQELEDLLEQKETILLRELAKCTSISEKYKHRKK